MKNMKIAMWLTLSLCASSMITGCNNDSRQLGYTVTCALEEGLHKDSATLLVLEDNYGQLRLCGSVHESNDAFTFTGQTDKPKAALIRFDNDSTMPFYFVLEPGNTNITIKRHSWDITGSPMSREYQHFINVRSQIMNLRVATWQQYLSMASDSTLKRDDELRMVQQDSLLNDSLQNMTIKLINRNDPVGRIIRQRFAHQLDKEHVKLLNQE